MPSHPFVDIMAGVEEEEEDEEDEDEDELAEEDDGLGETNDGKYVCFVRGRKN